MAAPTPVGQKVTLYTEQPPIVAPAVRAFQACWVEVAFQPEGAVVIVQQVGYWEIDHTLILPHVARWLHMSLVLIHPA
jgi:hypothetical protein